MRHPLNMQDPYWHLAYLRYENFFRFQEGQNRFVSNSLMIFSSPLLPQTKKRPDAIKHPGENGDEKIVPLFSNPFDAACPPTFGGTEKDP